MDTLNFILVFLFSLMLAVILTILVRKLAFKVAILDYPDGKRKKHLKPIPLMGGLAIWLSFWVVTGYIIFFTTAFSKSISSTQLFGMFIASCILIILGILDDTFSLSPKIRLPITIVAAIIVVIGGIGLREVTNPLGGSINLALWPLSVAIFDKIFVLGDLVVFFWLMGMMYTTKILDGLDGLATGITLIGALMIFFLTQTTKFYQPEVGLLALIFAGCCLGFLIFNFNPARIFLGESGSLFLGFTLGVLAVISGGKIATALLVMAVPILDLARVVIIRFFSGKKVSQGDREHLHFRLLDAGMGERKTVLVLYAISFLFGLTTLVLPSRLKLATLGILVLGMIGVGIWLRKQRIKVEYSK
jgi:UDP-GlcNAc:undecaprenyl-phosphate GlcNAc-1-phosphate transferase